jgi:predicted DNA-binding transcriptional regulator AlpA
MLGVNRDRIRRMTECGQLRWVFNLAGPRGAIPFLRFWLEELRDPATARSTPWEQAIRAILPFEFRPSLRTAEVSALLDISGPALWQMIRQGRLPSEIKRHVAWVPRDAVADWLNRAWLSRPADTIDPVRSLIPSPSPRPPRYGMCKEQHTSQGLPFSLAARRTHRQHLPAVQTPPRPQKAKLKAFKGRGGPVSKSLQPQPTASPP